MHIHVQSYASYLHGCSQDFFVPTVKSLELDDTFDNIQEQYQILQLEGNLITTNQEKILNQDKVHEIIENNTKHWIFLCFPQA